MKRTALSIDAHEIEQSLQSIASLMLALLIGEESSTIKYHLLGW